MAGEICNAARPLTPLPPPAAPPASALLSSRPTTCPQRDRQADRGGGEERERGRETWRNPPRPSSSVPSQGDISPLTLWVNRRAVMAVFFLPPARVLHAFRQVDLTITRAGGDTHGRAEITGPRNYREPRAERRAAGLSQDVEHDMFNYKHRTNLTPSNRPDLKLHFPSTPC
ncbi:unnamed protein product [Pleuronectes platessa]|uniref:Uncharacterized protein n=1 Tax=Pleuronectes platessa TaxID=8262 RepID=A0A9N7YW66_PLEPL|nr:unnamed protein product [Pleuronectes platessa]